jgi:hypothetical protein
MAWFQAHLNGSRISLGACRLQRAKCWGPKTGLMGLNGPHELKWAQNRQSCKHSWRILGHSKCRLQHKYRDFWYLTLSSNTGSKKHVISNDDIEYNQRSSHQIPTCSHWFVYNRNHIMPDQFDQSSFVFWWLQHIVATYCIHWGNFHPMLIKTPGYVAALLPRAPAISKSSPTCVIPNDSNHPFIFSPQMEVS